MIFKVSSCLSLMKGVFMPSSWGFQRTEWKGRTSLNYQMLYACTYLKAPWMNLRFSQPLLKFFSLKSNCIVLRVFLEMTFHLFPGPFSTSFFPVTLVTKLLRTTKLLFWGICLEAYICCLRSNRFGIIHWTAVTLKIVTFVSIKTF